MMHFILQSIWYLVGLPIFILLMAIVLSVALHLNFFRSLIALILPPISVIDKGAEYVVIVLILWLLGWIPGVIAAFYILNKEEKKKRELLESQTKIEE